MRTRFVIHKNMLSTVYRVRKRPVIYTAWGTPEPWHPEDICVENPKRADINGYFILPKSDYVSCNSKGQTIKVQGTANVETATFFNGRSQ